MQRKDLRLDDYKLSVSIYICFAHDLYDVCLSVLRVVMLRNEATKNCVRIVCNHGDLSETNRLPIADQSPTSLRPPKTFLRSIWSHRDFTCSTQNLFVTKSSLPPSCDICNLSATSWRPPCDLSATSLRPPKIMFARRASTGCKLCVTGVLLTMRHIAEVYDCEPYFLKYHT